MFIFVCFTSGQLGEEPRTQEGQKEEEEKKKRGACLDEILCVMSLRVDLN